jgi:glycosyltransferase involved in cell wall biosynthesis
MNAGRSALVKIDDGNISMGTPSTLKILHVLSQRPDSTGSGIYLQAMLREAAACRHRNFLVSGIQSDQPVDLDDIASDHCAFVRFGAADIVYPIVGMSDVMPYVSSRFCDLSGSELREYEAAFAMRIKEAVARFQPDIIHSHHLWIVSALVRRLFPEIPLVTTCHGSDLRQFQNCAHLQKTVLSGCRQLDAVMALSATQKTDIERLYGLPAEKVAVVGAGYNDKLFSLNPKTTADPVRLVYAGKLSKAKGVPWFLRALTTITSPAWQLDLVGGGSGEEKAQCLALARQTGDRVQVHGAVSQQRLADIMQQAHIFVLPSFYEGLPLVVLEALASGCRVVATDLPGVTDLLGEVSADFIELVKTPRLKHMDQPYIQDQQLFERNLAHALQTQIDASVRSPQIDLTPIRDKMAAYTWKGVFERVQDVYTRVLKQSKMK